MQDRIVSGDTLDFMTSLPDYPAATYTLKFRLVPRTSGTPVTITCTASGDDHRCTADAATTAAWTAGDYAWFSWVEKGAERYSVSEGQAVVVANPATQTTFDNRSASRIALDAVEAVIANRATLDQEEYSIAGRSLKRTPMADLLRLRSALRIDVGREDAANRRKLGLDDGRRIYLRASNA